MDSQTIQRYRDNWTDERNSAAIYQALSDVEKDERLKEVYRRMAKMELLHLSLIHISEPTRLLSTSYAVFCLKKKN